MDFKKLHPAGSLGAQLKTVDAVSKKYLCGLKYKNEKSIKNTRKKIGYFGC